MSKAFTFYIVLYKFKSEDSTIKQTIFANIQWLTNNNDNNPCSRFKENTNLQIRLTH